MPKFILLVLVGTFPDGELTMIPFSDRTGCVEASFAVSQVIRRPFNAFCYDTYEGRIVQMRGGG